jgi:formyltetrahydrofolate hydrolase
MSSLIVIFSKKLEQHKFIYSTISNFNWDKIYSICDNEIFDKVEEITNLEKIGIDFSNEEIAKEKILNFFKKIKDFEVLIDLTSSSGRKDMLILNCLIKSGLGFRFVKSKNNKLINY